MANETIKVNGEAEKASVKSAATKETKKPSVAKTNKTNTRFVIVTLGQGGFNVGKVLSASLPNNPYLISINSSIQDIEQTKLSDDHWFKIGGENSNGAGKDRSRAKKYWKDFRADIKGTDKQIEAFPMFMGLYEEVLFHPTDFTFIITCFSADGGTGSGIGPRFTADLTNEIMKRESFFYNGKDYTIDDIDVKRPVVLGLVTKPDVNLGVTNIQNGLETFNEIEMCVNKLHLGNFFIADNNLDPSIKPASSEEMYKIINARIAAPFLKFLGMEMNSDLKCLDIQDKISMLRTPGCSSFSSITNNNNYQFVRPKGQSVSHVLYMLKSPLEENAEANAKKFVKDLEITSMNTNIIEFDINDTGISGSMAKALFEESMIGFFGWNNLSVIVEDLLERKRRLEELNAKKAAAIADSTKSFETVKEDSAKLKDKLTMKAVDTSDLDDIFG